MPHQIHLKACSETSSTYQPRSEFVAAATKSLVVAVAVAGASDDADPAVFDAAVAAVGKDWSSWACGVDIAAGENWHLALDATELEN